MDDDEQQQPSPREEDVASWRKDTFMQLGFESHVAHYLSLLDADLALARKLHKMGCPQHLMVGILVGSLDTVE